MSRKPSAPNATVRRVAILSALLGAAAVLFVFLDNQRALLPAEWYCRFGAGEWVVRPGGTRFCKHGTIWGAILARPFYVAP
jgi:hypothetical protein